MHEVEARSATRHDRTPFDGSATVAGNREPSPAASDNTSERGVPDQDGATALPCLAATSMGGDPARSRAVP